MSRDTVVIIAGRDNCQAGCVAREITQFYGAKALVLDPSTFISEGALSFRVFPRGELLFALRINGVEVSQENLAGVWYPNCQTAQPGGVASTGFASLRCPLLIEEWLSCLGDLVVNPMRSLLDVPPGVLAQQAALHGLTTARLLATNSREEAKKFCADAAGPISIQPLKHVPGLSPQDCHFKRELPPWFCEAGAILQEEPEAKEQVVATVVGEATFCVSFPAPSLRGSSDDAWLDEIAANTQAHVLPQSVIQNLLRLTHSLKLTLCTFTLQKNMAGEYVLREAHPQGRFLFAEMHSGLPISRALAALLLKRKTGG